MVYAVVIAVVLLGGLLSYAATRPDSFRVQRSVRIHAPAERIYALLGDFRRWPEWSPWDRLDPAMKKSYSGAASGPGAICEWRGNASVGEGRMEVSASVPPALLTIRLEFHKPFKATNTAEFSLVTHEASVEVTWAMYGPSPFLSKLAGLFFSMDRMVGGQFEDGLARLKALAEAP